MTSTTSNLVIASLDQPSKLRTTADLPAVTRVQPRAASSRKAALWTTSSLVLLLVIAVLGRRSWITPVVAAEQHESQVRVVSVALPSPMTAADVQLPATIRPWQSATLSARVSGYLKEWKVDLGGRVQAGDLLAEIETPELDQELAQGIALANEAKAAVEQAKAELNEAEADVQAGEADLGRARAEVNLARIQLARREKLLATKAVSQEEFDTWFKEVETRNADVMAAEAELARRQANIGTRTAVIEVREATAKSSLANVSRLQELQSFQRIYAPFSGVVTRRDAEVGMLITAGKEPLFTIEDMSRVRVQVQVPQTYAMQTRVGANTTVGLPEEASAEMGAVVTRTANAVDPITRTMLAEIELENREGRWQPGSYAQVRIAIAANDSSWTIPTNTLQMRVDGPHVVVVDEANGLEVRPVELGRDLGDRIMVASGIAGDERLVVNPGDDLTSGMSVKIHEHENQFAQR